MKIAVFPGSFDPFTRGHEALVEEALKLFDRVIIGVGDNILKSNLLTVQARKKLIDDLYHDNARVEAKIYKGLTGDFATDQNAIAIIRGVRNTTDFEYERTMEAANHRLYPELTTVMLFTPLDVADISSSTVREVLSFGRSVKEFIPKNTDIKNYLEPSSSSIKKPL
ncbi:MAG: pantetheine-phosphate adenylyltransferase [Alistipes sp.]